MNRKNLLQLMVVIMTIILNIEFVSCSKNDDNGKDSDLIGTWKGYSCASSDPNDLSKNHVLALVFNTDGSGNYLEIDNSYTDQCSFTYEKESNTRAKAYISTRASFQYYEIVGNKMYVYGHGYGKDLDFLLTKQ